jgi:hypothetical protein
MSPVRHGRFTLLLAALLALVLVLAGCGGDDDSGGTTAATGSERAGAGGSSEDPGDDGARRPSGEAASTTAGGHGTPPAVLEEAREFGSEASGSEAEEAEAALLGYLEAQAGGEWSKACSYLTKELRSLEAKIARSGQGGGEGCPGFVAATTERLSPSERSSLAEVDIQSVRIEGRRGYVVYTDSAGTEIAKPVQVEAGEWKLSSLLVRLLQQARSRE